MCCGRPRVGLSLWIIHSPSFWFIKYHKCPGGSAATLIRHIRQLTGEYLQRTLRLSLDLAQEINNSPDRYNPWLIWAMGVGSKKVGWACLWLVHRVGLTEAIKPLRLLCISYTTHFNARKRSVNILIALLGGSSGYKSPLIAWPWESTVHGKRKICSGNSLIHNISVERVCAGDFSGSISFFCVSDWNKLFYKKVWGVKGNFWNSMHF